jgi:predicted porin
VIKKTVLGVVAAVAASSGLAQSSVTIFGVVDSAIGYGKGSLSTKTQVYPSAQLSSRLGFRGVEDLGGGLRGLFTLEAGLNNDSGLGVGTNSNNQLSGITPAGGLTFNRRAAVGLAGPFGEVRIGRDFATVHWTNATMDPFGALGVGTTQTLISSIGGLGTTGISVSNTIAYFTPGCSAPIGCKGFYGQFQGYLGEVNSGLPTSGSGNGAGLRAGWANSVVNVALAASKTKFSTGDITNVNFGGQYGTSFAKFVTILSYSKVDSPVAVTGKGWLVGANVPVGAGELRVAYSTYKTDAGLNPQTDKLALGYAHFLSKRTSLYATAARLKNKGGAAQSLNGSTTAPNGSSTGFDLGISHTF